MIGFSIRVVYAAKALPYPVHVHLPPASGAPRSPPSFRTSGPELDINAPEGDEPHLKLGLFMDAWSQLEQIIVLVLAGLLQTDHRRARIVLDAANTRQLIEILKGLSYLTLNELHRSELFRLAERMGRLNSRRNVLVHGHWVLEALVSVRKGEAILHCHFLRETTPNDPEVARLILKPQNQKERVRHCFTLKRIDGATRDAKALTKDFAAFVTVHFPHTYRGAANSEADSITADTASATKQHNRDVIGKPLGRRV
jgi:hypothetical protein